ncbi:hypothetical protein [Bythopirellula goksoeyrii]|uniref:Uncharacterized protein n=1 Tax=Bythopirellula goksoeyrii TaxID=1400387 RepID=A0A5B9Q8K2_9BACT|nr:hypothetical protein [Bythopirellula goksoeyrii]QEG33236.1 hypothetical protein Pr1d_04970 [Bythopirellula goksoeyrii]
MEWLFERMIELAAWVAFILGLFFLCEAVWMLVQWFINRADVDSTLFLMNSAQAAGAFVASALAVGALACIDRYVFDFDDPK